MSSSAPLHMWLSYHSCNINYISFLTTETSDFSYWNKPSVIVLILDSLIVSWMIQSNRKKEMKALCQEHQSAYMIWFSIHFFPPQKMRHLFSAVSHNSYF